MAAAQIFFFLGGGDLGKRVAWFPVEQLHGGSGDDSAVKQHIQAASRSMLALPVSRPVADRRIAPQPGAFYALVSTISPIISARRFLCYCLSR